MSARHTPAASRALSPARHGADASDEYRTDLGPYDGLAESAQQHTPGREGYDHGEGSDVTSQLASDPAPSSPAATASTTCSPRATGPGSGERPTRCWPAASPIHAVPSDDERAADLLEAARVSATVTDPHLLRVLDCDDDDGITWVVNEWGDGVSLDLMLQQGTLPPSRAAWLTREVADAIAAGARPGRRARAAEPGGRAGHARRGGQADRVRRRRQPRAHPATRPAVRRARRRARPT